MRHPQIVLFEGDAALAGHLEAAAQERRWLLRQSRQAPACLTLLKRGGPSVLVVRIGRHVVRELTFVDQVHAALPDVPIVAAGDAEDPALAVLALELGASFVVAPPQLRQDVGPVIIRLMEAAIRRAGRQPAAEPLEPEPELTDEPQP